MAVDDRGERGEPLNPLPTQDLVLVERLVGDSDADVDLLNLNPDRGEVHGGKGKRGTRLRSL